MLGTRQEGGTRMQQEVQLLRENRGKPEYKLLSFWQELFSPAVDIEKQAKLTYQITGLGSLISPVMVMSRWAGPGTRLHSDTSLSTITGSFTDPNILHPNEAPCGEDVLFQRRGGNCRITDCQPRQRRRSQLPAVSLSHCLSITRHTTE